MDHLPESSFDLIKELDKLFPERSPSLTDSEREVWAKAGERRVIQFLLSLQHKQTKRRKFFEQPDDDPEDNDV